MIFFPEFNILHDPLLPYIHFPFVDLLIVEPLSRINYRAAPHAHETVFFALCYTAIYLISQYTCPRVFSKYWLSMKLKDQIYFHIHVVSMVQCLFILVLILPMMESPPLVEDHVFGYTEYSGLVSAASSGYFIWDFFTSLRHAKKFGPLFTLHGLISFFVCFVGGFPFILYYGPYFLLFELSTPFLNIRWFDLKMPGFFSKKFILINNIILIFVFFFVRICFGWYEIISLFLDCWSAKSDPRFSYLNAFIILGSNFVLDILNLYWFNLMFRVALKTLQKLWNGETEDLQIDEETLKKLK